VYLSCDLGNGLFSIFFQKIVVDGCILKQLLYLKLRVFMNAKMKITSKYHKYV